MPPPVQAEMREGTELKPDAEIEHPLTVSDGCCSIFLQVDVKQGWAAS